MIDELYSIDTENLRNETDLFRLCHVKGRISYLQVNSEVGMTQQDALLLRAARMRTDILGLLSTWSRGCCRGKDDC